MKKSGDGSSNLNNSMDLRATSQFRVRLLAISLSVAVSSGLMALKFYAYWLTGSTAILSDALESIINVVASSFALGSIIFAAKSPDPSHPYGHGKIEFFSAGFEGALIILAALGIFYQAWPQLLHPRGLPHLSGGVLILLGVNVVNLGLGAGLVLVGKRTQSLVLVADGKHILTDVYTTGGVLLGLGLVLLTGWYWLDGAVAFLVGVNIIITGAKLVRQAVAGLMDASAPQLLQEIAAILQKHRKSIWIDVHQLRARRSGDRVHVDFHLILPRDLSLEEGHREVKDLEKIFQSHFGPAADILIHLDPCEDPICPICGYNPCRHRQADTRQQSLWPPEVLTAKPEG
ncbi:MAG: cation diffusion facilitator family transporter [Syntrophales bacterium]|nr:cation diffusion facilitator family transporter [Syntrophales bacterium]MDD5640303.1 cation diffusion facilitator family transporter [Syntrophales bacterium]